MFIMYSYYFKSKKYRKSTIRKKKKVIISPQIEEFFINLTIKSNSNLVEWSSGTQSNSFEYIFCSGKIIVNKIYIEDINTTNIFVNIENMNGITALIASEDNVKNNEKFQLLSDLYNSASKSYYKIDQTISSFSQELETNL